MKNFSVIALVLLGFLTFSSLFIVEEGQKAFVLQFSKVKRDADGNSVVYEPGLHFKYPLIERVKRLDSRIQTLDDSADRFVTAEKKDLIARCTIKSG